MTSLTPDRRQSKTLILSTNVDQNLLETEFLIAICRPTGNKWQPKTLFLAIFDPRSSIVKSVFDCRLSGVSIRSPHEKNSRCARRLKPQIVIDCSAIETILNSEPLFSNYCFKRANNKGANQPSRLVCVCLH